MTVGGLDKVAGGIQPILPRVTPLCVFAAGRRTFDAVVRFARRDNAQEDARHVKNILFEDLPLAEHGWVFSDTSVRFVGAAQDGFVFRVERP